MTDFERKITSEKALDAAIRQLKTQDDWFLTTKTGLAKRIVTLYDEIIAAADFPVSLPVRDVLNYSSAAFMNYVKLGCNYITRKFNVPPQPHHRLLLRLQLQQRSHSRKSFLSLHH